MSISNKCMLLLSGGVDSTTLLYELINKGKSVNCLVFDYGQRLAIEIKYAERICKALGVKVNVIKCDLSYLKSCCLTNWELKIPVDRKEKEIESKTPVSYVPFRNGLFLSIAVAIAEDSGVKKIYCGGNGLDSGLYWDDRKEFCEAFNLAVKEGTDPGSGIKVYFPYSEISKSEIVRRGLALGIDYDYTYSCYKGEKSHCWRCDSCFQRSRAFKEGGYWDLNKVYRVNEIVRSVQGEGGAMGKACQFLRFSGCNLKCRFCDTPHESYREMTGGEILTELGQSNIKYLSLCGGEPTLQVDRNLVSLLKSEGYKLHLETNGLIRPPLGMDYIVVSPKTKNFDRIKENFKNIKINELRFIIENKKSLRYMESCNLRAERRYLSPVFNGEVINKEALGLCLEYIKMHPGYRLGSQVHKFWGVI